MKSIEVEGKTVDEAVKSALDQLGVSEDEVNVEVLQEESAGFFGIGSKDAKVRVSLKADEDSEEEVKGFVSKTSISMSSSSLSTADGENDVQYRASTSSESHSYPEKNKESKTLDDEDFRQRLESAADAIDEFLNKLLEHFNLQDANEVMVEVQENRIYAEINGDDCGILIGRRGETLRSIQYLCTLVANKTAKTRVRFTLDIGSYKAKHRSSVASLAKRTANKAINTGQAFELAPMSAADRRVVHEALNDFDGIVTYSEGEEPRRYVVIDLEYDEYEDYDKDSDDFMDSEDYSEE